MNRLRSLLVLLTAVVLAAAVAPGATAQRPPAFVALAGATAAQSAPSAEDPFVSFLPRPEKVFLQKSDLFPGFGNALVFVQLNAEEAADLTAQTGRDDFIVLGEEGDQIILRDDGQGGDPVPGDLEFTGVVTVDDADLADRGAQDQANADATTTVPVFDGRVMTGEEAPQPFDSDGFAAGRKVQLVEPVESVAAAQMAMKIPLIGSDGDPVPLPAASHGSAFQDKVLMITDIGVVQDPSRTFDPCTGGNPNGVWTFKHIITEMANQSASGIDPAVFAEQWLKHWLSNQTINTFNVPARPNMNFILSNWPRKSDGTLDLDQSPLRLLAIVSRLDLANTRGGGSGYGTRTGDFLDGGEARFIFGFLDGCTPLPFSVIFEFRVPKCTCLDVKSWAKQWISLNSYTLGSATYNAHLERITEQFVRAGSAPTRPNGSAIGQVRTDEIFLSAPWELREFQLDQRFFSFLHEKTTADTPDDSFNGTAAFADWVRNKVIPGLPNNVPKVQLIFSPHGNFLGAHPQEPTAAFFWDEASLDVCGNPLERTGRFTASINSCNGCHSGETSTPFVQVDPSTPLGTPAFLSGFLTGINVSDPAMVARGCPAVVRHFDDLDRRELDIKRKARMSCFRAHPVRISLVRSSLSASGTLPPDLFGPTPPEPPENQVPVTFDPLIGNFIIQVH